MLGVVNIATDGIGTVFWGCHGNSNRLFKKIGPAKLAVKPSRIKNIQGATSIPDKVFYVPVLFAGPNGQGIEYAPYRNHTSTAYFYQPQFAVQCADTGEDIPWHGWTTLEEELDIHAYYICIDGMAHTEASLSLLSTVDTLMHLIYHNLEDPQYTLGYLDNLSLYEKKTFIQEIVKKTDNLSDLIIY